MTVRLWDYWRSSASWRVRIGLALAGIEAEVIPVDLLAGEQGGEAHLARNPQGLVPVLEIDGLRLTQSLAILDYLDETRALGLLPPGAADRARVRALAQSIAVDLHPVCNLRVAAQAAGPDEAARSAWMRRFIGPGLAAFDALLAGFEPTPFCVGDRPGLADLCLIPQLYNARRWGVPLDAHPRLLAIEVACARHPAFVAARPQAPA